MSVAGSDITNDQGEVGVRNYHGVLQTDQRHETAPWVKKTRV